MNLSPLLTGKYSPSLDGAAHFYNAKLIVSLLFDSGGSISDYYSLNNDIIPNWTGHIILAFFSYFLPGFIAEKILVLCYAMGLPYVFRQLILTINPSGRMFSYFIFPFVYSTPFHFGFYNFSLGILLLFLTLFYWIRIREKKRVINGICLTVLLILLYFSHIVTFGITVIVIGLSIIFESLSTYFKRELETKKIVSNALNDVVFITVSGLLPFVLSANYFYKRSILEESYYLTYSQLIEKLYKLETLIGYVYEEELTITMCLSFILFALVIIVFILRIRNKLINKKRLLVVNDMWLSITIFILVLYFILPDVSHSGGFISIRLSYLFYMFLIVWLSANFFPYKAGVIVATIVVLLNSYLLVSYTRITYQLNKGIAQIMEVESFIDENSYVLPVNFSDNWLMSHFSNYLGINKKVVILENYEAAAGYFPVILNSKNMPSIKLGTLSKEEVECVHWLDNPKNKEHVIEYVFIYGHENEIECRKEFLAKISSDYSLKYRNDFVRLYELKNYTSGYNRLL